MLVIGLTGGIGTGKSEVSRILGELGATIIDADRVGHEAYSPHTQVWQQVVETFGEEIVQPTGEIDRKRLGALIFNDPAAREALNAIMHPRMAETFAQRISELRKRGVEVAVLEAAVLVEAGWDSLVDEIWVTYSPEGTVVERLRRRPGKGEEVLSEGEIIDRIGSQLPFEERSRHAQVVVENSGSIEELRLKVESLWGSRVKGKAG